MTVVFMLKQQQKEDSWLALKFSCSYVCFHLLYTRMLSEPG